MPTVNRAGTRKATNGGTDGPGRDAMKADHCLRSISPVAYSSCVPCAESSSFLLLVPPALLDRKSWVPKLVYL